MSRCNTPLCHCFLNTKPFFSPLDNAINDNQGDEVSFGVWRQKKLMFPTDQSPSGEV